MNYREMTINQLFDEVIRLKNENNELKNLLDVNIHSTEVAEKALQKSDERYKLLNEVSNELIEKVKIKEAYKYISDKLHQLFPEAIVLINSIDEKNGESCLEHVSGIDNKLLNKILNYSGFNFIGMKFKLVPKYTDLFRSEKLIEIESGLVEFSNMQFPVNISKYIENLIGINKIYTIGINNNNNLFAAVHFFTFNKSEIKDSGLVQDLLRQAGLIISKKIAELEIIQQKEQYRNLAENISDVLWFTDMNLKTIFVSPSIFKLTGYSPEEFSIKTMEEKHPPEQIQMMINTFNEEVTFERKNHPTTNRSRIIEVEYIRKDGSKVWTEMNVSFVRDEQGKPIGVQGVTRNIEKRKQIENELLSSEETYKSVLNSIEEAIYIQDETGAFIDVNKGAELVYGCSREELIGKTPLDVAAPGMNNLDETQRLSFEVLRTGKPARFDFWAVRKNGEVFPKEVIVNRGTYKGKVCLIATAREISDRIEREKALQNALSRNKTILQAIPDLMFVFDKNHKFLEYHFNNDELLYTKPENFLGKNVAEVLPQEVGNSFVFHIDNVLKNGYTDNYEYSLEINNNEYFFEARFAKTLDNQVLCIIRDITSLKVAEQKLEKSKTSLKLAMEVAKIGYWEYDCRTNNVEWSDGHNLLYGVKLEDFGGTLEHVQEYVHPDDRQMGIDNLNYAMENDIPFDNTYRVIHPDGSLHWLHSYGSIKKDDKGNLLTIFGISQDITDRVNKENEIKKSEEKFRLIAENTSDGILVFEDKRITYVSPSYLAINGYTEEEELGRTAQDIVDLIHPDDAAEVLNKIFSAQALQQESIKYEVRILHKAGHYYWREDHTKYIYNPDGTVKRTYIISRDINERKKLDERFEILRLAVEQSPASIVITDTNGNIEYVNSQFEQSSGYTISEVYGKNPRILKSDIHPNEYYAEQWNMLKAGKTWRGEICNKKKNGELFWELALISPIVDSNGEITNYLAIKENITERKRIEKAIENHQKELELLIETTKIANSRLDIDFVLDYIIQITTKTVNSSVGMIFLIEPESNELSWGASIGLSDDFVKSFKEMKIKYGEGLTGMIAQTGEAIYIREDSSNDPRIQRSVIVSEGLNSFIGVPIRANDEIVGVMNITTRAPEILTENDIHICKIIASQVGFAIRNAQLYARQKEVESQLIESEEKYRKIFENVQDIIYQTDMFGVILDISPSIERHSGYKREELIGKQILEFYVNPNDRKNFVNELIRNGSVSNFEVDLKAKDNRVVIASVTAQLIKDKEGNPEKIEGVLHDITDRKKAEIALRESEAQFRSLFENAADAIFIADINTGIILDANNAASRLVKLPIEKIIGLHQTDLHPKEDKNFSHESFNQHIADIEANNLSNLIENYVVASDGTLSVVEVLASTVIYNGRKAIMGVFRDISERKLYEKELKQAKETAELNSANVTAIIENTTSSIWAFNANYEIIYINKVFQDEFNAGFGVKLVSGSNLLESLPSFLQPLWKPRYDRVLQGEQFTFEDAVDTGYGIIYIEVSMNPITKNGEVVGGSCFASNITERKIAEKELQHLNNMQSILMNIASKYINISLDKVDDTIQESLEELGKFAQADRVYIFDYNWENFVCNNTYEWCHAGITPEIDNLQEVPLEMMPWWIEKHKKGEALYIPNVQSLSEDDGVRVLLEPQGVKSLITFPLMNYNQCIGFVGFDSVINHHNYTQSEQKLLNIFAQLLVNIQNRVNLQNDLIVAKDTAEENERKVRSMFENSLVGFLYCNLTGDLLEANPAALKILGSPSLEDTKTINLLNFEPLVNVGFSSNLQKSIDNKVMKTDEDVYTSKWGKTAYIKYYIIPLIKNDIVTGVWINLQDLTDIWKIQQDLISAKEKAEESDRLKTAFLQNISHEIRTPINGIVGFAKLLSEFDLSSHERMEYGGLLTKSCNRLLNTIDDFIDIAKIDSNQFDIKITEFSPIDLIDTLYNKHKSVIAKELEFAINLGNVEKNQTIKSDEYLVMEIIESFLSNAEKFTKRGKVELGTTIENNSLIFYVKDTGIGIAENHIERIYDRFYQTDLSITRGFEGAGLGLSIAKGLAEILGGKIWAESRIDEGSTFYFSLEIGKI